MPQTLASTCQSVQLLFPHKQISLLLDHCNHTWGHRLVHHPHGFCLGHTRIFTVTTMSVHWNSLRAHSHCCGTLELPPPNPLSVTISYLILLIMPSLPFDKLNATNYDDWKIQMEACWAYSLVQNVYPHHDHIITCSLLVALHVLFTLQLSTYASDTEDVCYFILYIFICN